MALEAACGGLFGACLAACRGFRCGAAEAIRDPGECLINWIHLAIVRPLLFASPTRCRNAAKGDQVLPWPKKRIAVEHKAISSNLLKDSGDSW